jgi:GntR family transcriptional regulator
VYDTGGPMSAAITVDPRDAVPIWRQIEEGMRRLVAVGALAPAAPVPSVRDLARDLGVNPMTVSKAYQRLADAGVLEVRRGEGTFVAGTPPKVGTVERTRSMKDAAVRYAGVAMGLGAAEDDATAAVKDAWAALTKRPRGEKR